MKIDIEGQDFDLNPEIISGILDAMESTAKDGLEHGFTMCQTDNGITPGTKCTGNSCSIKLLGCPTGKKIGSFHSHPDVISFSLGDYVSSVHEAKENPENKYLLCVGLLNKGIRCKALKEMPTDKFLKTIPHIDSNFTRDMIKPYYTKKINISAESLKKLLAGAPWSEIDTQTEVVAIDEGDVVAPSAAISAISEPETPKESLLAYAAKFTEKPSGKYPWGTKQVTMSVAGPAGGVGLVNKEMPTLESDVTQWVETDNIEIPDPSLIHLGEVSGYMGAMSPVILTKLKDDKGKYKILDGRHRLAAWRASGYTKVPVVFSLDTDYK